MVSAKPEHQSGIRFSASDLEWGAKHFWQFVVDRAVVRRAIHHRQYRGGRSVADWPGTRGLRHRAGSLFPIVVRQSASEMAYTLCSDPSASNIGDNLPAAF